MILTHSKLEKHGHRILFKSRIRKEFDFFFPLRVFNSSEAVHRGLLSKLGASQIYVSFILGKRFSKTSCKAYYPSQALK